MNASAKRFVAIAHARAAASATTIHVQRTASASDRARSPDSTTNGSENSVCLDVDVAEDRRERGQSARARHRLRGVFHRGMRSSRSPRRSSVFRDDLIDEVVDRLRRA